MANQRMVGGTQKITTPLATEHSVRNAPRGIEDIFNLEYVTRLFQDASIPNVKLVSGGSGGIPNVVHYYAASLYQEGTAVPDVTEFTRTFGGTVTPARNDVGVYQLNFSLDIFATYPNSVVLASSVLSSDPNELVIAIRNGITPSSIGIATFLNGVPADDVLQNDIIVFIFE